jgi:hypothetical protein
MTRPRLRGEVREHVNNSQRDDVETFAAKRSRLAQLIGRLLARHWFSANADQLSPSKDCSTADRSDE